MLSLAVHHKTHNNDKNANFQFTQRTIEAFRVDKLFSKFSLSACDAVKIGENNETQIAKNSCLNLLFVRSRTWTQRTRVPVTHLTRRTSISGRRRTPRRPAATRQRRPAVAAHRARITPMAPATDTRRRRPARKNVRCATAPMRRKVSTFC